MKYITIHETANTGRGANANAHARLQAGVNSRLASWTYQVDSTEIVQSFDDNVRCWHAGKQANDESIAIEVCVNSDGDYEKALANAAALVAHLRRKHNIPWNRVVSHNFWTGKNCPRIMLSQRGRWDKFIAATNPGSTRPPVSSLGYSSPLPVGCRFTSGFATKARPLHMGADWGPIKPGQRGTPVFAPYEYTVVSVGRGNGTASARIPYHSGRHVFLDLGVHGGDRMYFYVGHLDSYSVRVGQKGNAGDQIGVMGGSGPNGQNDFAIHAHIGISVNHNKPIAKWNAKTNKGWTDPVVWFRSKGITVGTTPPITHTAVDVTGTAAEAKESELSMSDVNKILAELKKTSSGNQVKAVYVRQREYQNEILKEVNKKASANQVNAVYVRQREYQAELKEMIEQVAESTGTEINYDKVREAAKEGAKQALEEGLDIEAEATVTFHAADEDEVDE